MKYTYEKILKHLLKNYYNNQCDGITDNKLFKLHATDKNVTIAFDTLCAKDLISIKIDGYNEIFDAWFEPKGLTYFEDKHEKLKYFWLPVLISTLALIGAYRQELVWLIQELVKLLI